MQLGISTYTYGWAVGAPGALPTKPLTELDLLQQAQAFGLRLVQFGDNLPVHALPPDRLTTLHQAARAAGITLEIGARGLTTDHLRQYIALAEKLEARLLRFVIDAPGYEPDLHQVIQIITAQVPALTDKNIVLGLENHDRLKAREFAQIIDRVNSPHVGICLDSVNSLGAGEGLEQVVATLAPYTVNLHVKDFDIRRLPHLMGFQIEGCPAGQGRLNVPWLLAQLAPYAHCRTAVLEQWVVPETKLAATLPKEAAWAAASITYLTPYFET